MSGGACPMCGDTDTSTHPGELGYGVHVSCAGCGFPLDYRERREYAISEVVE